MALRTQLLRTTTVLSFILAAPAFSDSALKPTFDHSHSTSLASTRFDLSRYGAAYSAYREERNGYDTSIWRSAEDTDQAMPDGASSSENSDTQNLRCARFTADLNADVGEIMRAGCQPTLAQMSKLMDNPLGNVAMLFNQFDSYRMENPTNNEDAIQNNFMGILQFPKRLNDNWNLINRVIYNIPSLPIDQDKIDDFDLSTIPGGGIQPPSDGTLTPIKLFSGRETGFGDLYYNGLFSPSESIKMGEGNFLWGAGFDLAFPTASEDILGTGKYMAGPSALGVYMGPKWKIGALAQQYWDYAGDNDRSDVNLTNLQYFIFYSLNETTSIGAAPNIIANWEQNSSRDKFTVPLGIGINKTFQFGKVPVRIGFEVFYSAVQPDNVVGTKWSYRFYLIPAVPSALFKWMG